MADEAKTIGRYEFERDQARVERDEMSSRYAAISDKYDDAVARAKKAEWQVETLTQDQYDLLAKLRTAANWRERAEKAEASLARLEPLLADTQVAAERLVIENRRLREAIEKIADLCIEYSTTRRRDNEKCLGAKEP